MAVTSGKRKRFFEHPDHAQQENLPDGSKKQKKRRKMNPVVDKLLVEAKVKVPVPEKNNVSKLQVSKYVRGTPASLKGIQDKKLKSQLKSKEQLFAQSALTAAKVEQWLLPSEGGVLEADGLEETYEYTQEEIVREVDISSSRKAFDLKLPDLGPYTIDYTHDGRYVLLGGRKGHLAMVDWRTSHLVMETQVMETIRDVKFLHNEQFCAAAQKKYIYIYDKKGAEVHCLKEYISPLKLEFLRHHFLLASINKHGVLHYQDTTTGRIVADHRTRLGRCDVIRANPYNAVLSLGHSNGTVTMWSPNVGTPLITMLCHKGPVLSVAFDMGGRYMVTAGTDAKIKVWDVRKLEPLNSYSAISATKSLDISQKGLLAVGSGSDIEIWKDTFTVKQKKPYMKHRLVQASIVHDLSFCPYEDVLAIGHSSGFSSMLVPGSGEPNFDSFVANPFQTVKQRHEAEVHALLDKLQPEMIMLNPDKIGAVKKNITGNLKQQEEEANQPVEPKKKPNRVKRKTKGRNKSGKKEAKKQSNVFSVKRSVIRQQAQSKTTTKAADNRKKTKTQPLPRALARFAPK